MRQPLYLKRTIIWIMMMGYIALLVLLLVISWYLIGKYQADNQKNVMDTLTNYIDNIEEAMARIDGDLYDIYANNGDFDALSGLLSPLENYQHAYYLRESLKTKMLLDEDVHGYFIYYDRLSQSWYNVESSKINAAEASEINEKLRQTNSVESSSLRSWSIASGDTDILLVVSCRKENVAICAVHNLREVESELQQSLNQDCAVILINGSSVLMGQELEKELDLRQNIADSNDIYSGRLDGHYVYAARIERTDLWVSVVTPFNFWSVMNRPQLFLLIITACSVLAVFLLYVFLRKELIQPLRALTNLMNRVRTGESNSVPSINVRFKELRDVNDTLAAMVSEIEKQKLLVYEEIIEKQKAQMQYLQLQLKPHFYLNNLKTLNALALTGETEKMQELIFDLSTHIRYLLQSEREIVPLHFEIDFVKNYIDLQKHVNGRPVICKFNIEKEVLEWPVPVLCIQTFIENSVKYVKLGSSNMPLKLHVNAGLLSIDGKRFLDLTISDNGQGYPDKVLEEINAEAKKSKQNVGINNIKRRCRLLYGEQVEFRFITDGGAVSELIIPEEGTY